MKACGNCSYWSNRPTPTGRSLTVLDMLNGDCHNVTSDDWNKHLPREHSCPEHDRAHQDILDDRYDACYSYTG